MIFLYSTLLHTLLITGIPVLIIIILTSKKRRVTFLKRSGISPVIKRFNHRAASEIINRQGTVWVHALSVGEVISAVPLLEFIGKNSPGRKIAFSASTKTGFEVALNLFEKNPEMVDEVFYFPYDLPFSINRIARKINPSLVIIVESDIWPNFLNIMKMRNIPVFLVNARLSERSFRGYKRAGLLFRKVFCSFSGIGAQTDDDKKRFERLGIPPDKVEVTGNIKFDQPPPSMESGLASITSKDFNNQGHDLTVLAGSTHPGEEAVILESYSLLKEKHKGLGLIIAPRDPDRAEEIERLFSRRGKRTIMITDYVSESRSLKDNSADVIIVNIMGILAGLYSVADIAFIGGSLVSSGGHNPLEPAAFAKPVIFGNDMRDFALISRRLVENKAAFMVNSGMELTCTLESLIMDREKRQQAGENALEVFNSNKGAVRRTFTFMDEILGNPEA